MATPAATELCSRRYLLECLYRHLRGDWGELSEHDVQANERALLDGERLLSVYPLETGGSDAGRLWVLTEADRSATTLLLPSDY